MAASQSASVSTKSVSQLDPVWSRVRDEAEVIAHDEPALAGFLFATVINQTRLEDAIAHRLAQRLSSPDVDASLLLTTFDSVLEDVPHLGELFRSDMIAVIDRDPACHRFVDPLLYFKGFHAVQAHRFAHELYKAGRKDFAYYLQSQSSRVFSIDIHPGASVGRGIFVDHGHAIVVGETARIGDDVSMLHGVTLGGTGKDNEDRHPKIADGVLIGAGAKILGNIRVGECARVAAGSVVLEDVPAKKTVAGVPARIVGEAGCNEPSRTMNHMLQQAIAGEGI